MLIIGLILLMNTATEHVPGDFIYSYGEVEVNETYCYVVSIAPVGIGNITIGFFSPPESDIKIGNTPPGFLEPVTLPIHVKVEDPANQTLFEEDIISPYSFEVEFNLRGQYSVYLTNNGDEKSPIPMGVRFPYGEGNPINREADKFLLGIILSTLGMSFVALGLIIKLFLKRH